VSLLERVLSCRRHDLAGLVPFEVAGVRYGHAQPAFAGALFALGGAFVKTPRGIALRDDLDAPSARTAAVAADLERLARAEVLTGWHGEHYPVVEAWGEPEAFRVERAAAAPLGVKAFGVHLNAWVRGPGEPRLWVATRSASRRHAPGKLDHLVAGGQPAGLTLEENLVKECGEEAGLPPELARRAVPTGTFAYVASLPEGLRDDTLFTYELELPEDFAPRNTDGEVESFRLVPASEVRERLRATDDFKWNVGPCVILFLLRHGVIGPDDPEHDALLRELDAPVGGKPRPAG
jgi:8-oxo-dGTP pyrophosphatase MutT (NUDIX family)